METDFAESHELLRGFNDLQRQVEREYSLVVNDLIQSNCQDTESIAHILDGLLSFAGDGECLMLYRRLCRHLLALNPQYAADYIRFWQEEWDEKRERFGNGKKE